MVRNIHTRIFKELLMSWIRDESKTLLDMFFTEIESDNESGLEQKMNQAKEGLNSDDKNQRIEALKQVTDVIMVSKNVLLKL